MEDIGIGKVRGYKACLTVYSPQSHYGIPVLRIDDDNPYDLGPADSCGSKLAAEVVAGWAEKKNRTEKEKNAARLFLRQWPEGPQIE